ncbi:hypothetical protein GQ42DRAFT_72754 [Ramicandelaber brevisporus]|nr:hypothetical protein GQ42DRAFT_72754 [Ramicandelaber brevisporus]
MLACTSQRKKNSNNNKYESAPAPLFTFSDCTYYPTPNFCSDLPRTKTPSTSSTLYTCSNPQIITFTIIIIFQLVRLVFTSGSVEIFTSLSDCHCINQALSACCCKYVPPRLVVLSFDRLTQLDLHHRLIFGLLQSAQLCFFYLLLHKQSSSFLLLPLLPLLLLLLLLLLHHTLTSAHTFTHLLTPAPLSPSPSHLSSLCACGCLHFHFNLSLLPPTNQPDKHRNHQPDCHHCELHC